MTLPSIKVDQPFLISFDPKWLPKESTARRTYAQVAADSKPAAASLGDNSLPDSVGSVAAQDQPATTMSTSAGEDFFIPADYLAGKPPVRVRLISSRRRDFSTLSMPKVRQRSPSCGSLVPSGPQLSGTLIFHIHGGGFVACSSFTHTMNTRVWATDADAPVLSVDYRLAPRVSFPVQLVECIVAYKWALTNMALLGSTGEKIVIVGDSSGGNLVIGLITKAITEGFRIPDAAILIYPATYMHSEISCARLISLIDPLLNLRMLRALLPAYVPKQFQSSNMYISPAQMPDAILAQFPTTRLIVGQCDPLLDDSVYFYHRLRQLRVDTEIVVPPRVSHGYLNLNAIIVEADDAIDMVSLWILEAMGKPVERKPLNMPPPKVEMNAGELRADNPVSIVVATVPDTPSSASSTVVAVPVAVPASATVDVN